MCERCDLARWERDAIAAAWHSEPQNRRRALRARVDRIGAIMEAFERFIEEAKPFDPWKGGWKEFVEFEGAYSWAHRQEFSWRDPAWNYYIEKEEEEAEDSFLRKLRYAWDEVAVYMGRWDWDWVFNPPY